METEETFELLVNKFNISKDEAMQLMDDVKKSIEKDDLYEGIDELIEKYEGNPRKLFLSGAIHWMCCVLIDSSRAEAESGVESETESDIEDVPDETSGYIF